MPLPLRVVLVDDHQMFREGIRDRLQQEPDITVVGEAASADEAMTVIEAASPTIIILDIRLAGASGIELARNFRQQWPQLRILILSGYDFEQYVRAAMRVGIDGYLLKDAPQDALVGALREIAMGGAVLPPSIASKVMRTYAASPSSRDDWTPGDLTLREVDILELMHQGLRNQEIAKELPISIRTVESHVSAVLAKLGAQTRTEAIRVGVEKNLIK